MKTDRMGHIKKSAHRGGRADWKEKRRSSLLDFDAEEECLEGLAEIEGEGLGG